LDLLHLRLDALHEHLLLRAFVEKRIEDEADEDRGLDNREAEAMESGGVKKKNQGVEDRPVKDLLVKKNHYDCAFASAPRSASRKSFFVAFFTAGENNIKTSLPGMTALPAADLAWRLRKFRRTAVLPAAFPTITPILALSPSFFLTLTEKYGVRTVLNLREENS
jgi:hypothetical protein